MKNKIIKEKDMPIGKLTRVSDALPSPDKLIMPEETIKITIALKKSSVNFFKRKAEQYHTKYQKMLRELIDRYATQYSHS
jgi:hypothetical protein